MSTFRVEWSEEDGEWVGLCAEFPSLSWLHPDASEALNGIKRLVREVGNCKNCGGGIYRAQNHPMDGGWHWLHVVSRDRRCLVYAEPKLQI